MREPGQYLECLLWKARATAVLEKPELRPREHPAGSGDAESTADAYFKRDRPRAGPTATTATPSPPGRRSTARPSSASRRPPIVVYPGSTAAVTRLGNYLLELSGDAASTSVREEAALA